MLPAVMVNEAELEDELGDILEKAMKHAGMTAEVLARRSGVPVTKIKDAEDYRYDLAPAELHSLADVLKLNEIGLSALSGGCYPRPELKGLPFELHTLAMPFGVGRVNAYLIAERGSDTGILFDTGCHFEDLTPVWPEGIRRLSAIFLTHWDADHSGGLKEVREHHPEARVFAPPAPVSGFTVLAGTEEIRLPGFRIQVMSTQGHSEHHHSYHVRSAAKPGPGVLVSGDLVFAGSVACAFYSPRRLLANVRRVLAEMEGETVVAPGHGPLTTIENERRYNVFNY